MAKFRRNHDRKGKGASDSIVKVGIFSAILGGLFFLYNIFTGKGGEEQPIVDETAYADEYFLPTSGSGEIIHHQFYSLSYSEEHEQAEWVAYILTKQKLDLPWVERSDRFVPDPNVEGGSSTPDDYYRSGYDRGHLVPAADMAFSQEAMQETFYMSNISPQSSNFNKGIWRELEELTRNWAKKNKKLYVVTGPVLSVEIKGAIGENEVSVPAAYFKVLLDVEDPQQKGIAFIIPNQVLFEPLYEFAAPIDEVEELTGFDFFHDLLPDDTEEELESDYNIDLWEFSKQKYDRRTQEWNKQ